MQKEKHNAQFVFDHDYEEQIATPHLHTAQVDLVPIQNSNLMRKQSQSLPKQVKFQDQLNQQNALSPENSNRLIFQQQNAFSFRKPELLKVPCGNQSQINQQSDVHLISDLCSEKQEVYDYNANKIQGGLEANRNHRSRFKDIADSEVVNNNKSEEILSHLNHANRMAPSLFAPQDEKEQNQNTYGLLQNEKPPPFYSVAVKPPKANRSKLPPLPQTKNGQIFVNSSSVQVMGNQSSMMSLDPNQNIKMRHSKQLNLSKDMAASMTPVPLQNIMNCIFVRERNCWSYPMFSLVRKDMSFIACAKKQSCHLNSYYNITAQQQCSTSSSKSFLGYLKSNFSGTEFNLYEMYDGIHELACTICYKTELSCRSTFRSIEVYIRNVDIPYDELQGSNQGSNNLQELYQIGENNSSRKIVKLISKKPEWSQRNDCYLLNFRGRSKMASVKNMILTEEHQPKIYSLMFCKTGVDYFHLEMAHPLSPFIAIGILLSSFDFKLLCQ